MRRRAASRHNPANAYHAGRRRRGPCPSPSQAPRRTSSTSAGRLEKPRATDESRRPCRRLHALSDISVGLVGSAGWLREGGFGAVVPLQVEIG